MRHFKKAFGSNSLACHGMSWQRKEFFGLTVLEMVPVPDLSNMAKAWRQSSSSTMFTLIFYDYTLVDL